MFSRSQHLVLPIILSKHPAAYVTMLAARKLGLAFDRIDPFSKPIARQLAVLDQIFHNAAFRSRDSHLLFITVYVVIPQHEFSTTGLAIHRSWSAQKETGAAGKPQVKAGRTSCIPLQAYLPLIMYAVFAGTVKFGNMV